MGNVVGGITNALFGKGGMGTMAGAVGRAKELSSGMRFNPYTVRTSIGSTAYNPETGEYDTQLSGPLQDILNQTVAGTGSLFAQAAGFDPSVRAGEIVQEQAGLLEPLFAKQRQDIASDLFRTGRGGFQIAGESVGAGAGGMVNPEAYGLARAQSQTLAQLAPLARQQAYGEQASLMDMASTMLGAGLNLGQVETNLMSLGLTAEQARAAAEMGAGQFELSPTLAQAQMQEGRRSSNMGFFGSMVGAAVGGA